MLFYDKAVTGRKSRREGFEQFKQAIQSSNVDVSIIFATNRRGLPHELIVRDEETAKWVQQIFSSVAIPWFVSTGEPAGRVRRRLPLSL